MSQSNLPNSAARRGFVLLVVLVIISLLALGALAFSNLMTAEREGAEVAVTQSQARELAESGAEMIRIFLAQDPVTLQQSGGYYNNSAQFQAIAVTPETPQHGVGRFTIVSPNMVNGLPSGIRFGLEDDSGRLNLNALAAIEQKYQGKGIGRMMLMGLPGMSVNVADAILDWMDLDDEPREYGAEMQSYAGLTPPYAPRNGTPDTVEELLLVQGVNPSLMFGMDTNRNYLVDPSEANNVVVGADNSDGSLNSGWAAYLTLYSQEANLSSTGQPKIDLGQSDMKKLYDALESAVGGDWATFIVAYRQSSGYVNSQPNQKTVAPSSYKPDFTKKPGSAPITTVLDLITPQGKQLTVSGSQVLQSPFPDDPGSASGYLPKLMDNCTVGSPDTQIPRVNINVASSAVLTAVLSVLSVNQNAGQGTDQNANQNADQAATYDPSEYQQIVEQILSQRPQDPSQLQDSTYAHETWLYTSSIVSLDQMKKLMPYVCAGGSVYRAQVIGYFDMGGPAARVEVVVDATNSPPRIVFWRDMTNLGRGYPFETLGIQAMGTTTPATASP